MNADFYILRLQYSEAELTFIYSISNIKKGELIDVDNRMKHAGKSKRHKFHCGLIYCRGFY